MLESRLQKGSLHIGHHAQDHQGFRPGIHHAVAVSGGAVMGHAGAYLHSLAVVGADAGAGEEVHHLEAALVDMGADGAAHGKGELQDLALAIFKFADQGLPMAALEMRDGYLGDGRKIEKHR